MRAQCRCAVLVLVVAFAATACDDGTTGPDRFPIGQHPAAAKGGTPGPPDKGGDDGGSDDGTTGGGDAAASVALGEALFFESALSVNGNQSCASCHEPTQGFAAPLASTQDAVAEGAVVEGSVAGRFGDRKPPTAAYATLAPDFASSGSGAGGGLFWDGRATGRVLGSPAADQALGPFLNPKEQALPDAACVIHVVAHEPTYRADYQGAYGMDLETSIAWSAYPGLAEACDDPASEIVLSETDRAAVEEAYGNVARSVADYEATLNVFTSPFDAGTLTAEQERGLKLFDSSAKCGQCHDAKGDRPLFADFEYHNLGVPRNPSNPVYGSEGHDPGLGGFTGDPGHVGKFRTPTVRNVVVGDNRTYMHNGVLTSLVQVVDFYNTRDALPVCTDPAVLADPTRYGSEAFGGAGCWPPPEFGENLDTKRMGDLGLTEREVRAIVAFMESLSDR